MALAIFQPLRLPVSGNMPILHGRAAGKMVPLLQSELEMVRDINYVASKLTFHAFPIPKKLQVCEGWGHVLALQRERVPCGHGFRLEHSGLDEGSVPSADSRGGRKADQHIHLSLRLLREWIGESSLGGDVGWSTHGCLHTVSVPCGVSWTWLRVQDGWHCFSRCDLI